MYDYQFLKKIFGPLVPPNPSQEEVCNKYIKYLSRTTNLTEEEIFYSLVKDNPNYTNFVIENGKISSYGLTLSEWSMVDDEGNEYFFNSNNGYFYKKMR